MILMNILILANAFSHSGGVLTKDKKDLKDHQKESQSNEYNPLGAFVR
jgi:hypothetical protein